MSAVSDLAPLASLVCAVLLHLKGSVKDSVKGSVSKGQCEGQCEGQCVLPFVAAAVLLYLTSVPVPQHLRGSAAA